MIFLSLFHQFSLSTLHVSSSPVSSYNTAAKQNKYCWKIVAIEQLVISLKAMSHEPICPCNLQCNFCRNKYCGLQLGCQTYATCFATCNEIIFYARRVSKNVSGILIMSYCDWFLLQKITRQVAVGLSHAATCRVALRKVEAASTFSATCNAFVARLVANTGCHTRTSSLQLAMQRHCIASCRENCLV